MACRRDKDTSKLVAKLRVYPLGARWFYVAYLWQDRESMVAASDDGIECNAFCCHNKWAERVSGSVRTRIIPPFRGEIHFNAEYWDMESVAHECLHAALSLSGQIGLSPEKVFSGNGELTLCLPDELAEQCRSRLTDEELLCYIHGDMVNKVCRFLWEHAPAKGWNTEDIHAQ